MTIVRKLGLAIADTLEEDISRLERARRIKFREQCEIEYSDFIEPKMIAGVNGEIIKMWNSFERLLFNISKADGKVTMQDLWSMSIYELLRYKQLLFEHLSKSNRSE